MLFAIFKIVNSNSSYKLKLYQSFLFSHVYGIGNTAQESFELIVSYVYNLHLISSQATFSESH